MNIIGVQLILLFFAFFMVYVVFLHWKKKNISNITFVSWMLMWMGFIFFALFPQVLEPLIKDLFIMRVFDLVVIVAFMILTYITFENSVRMRKFDKQIECLVREVVVSGGFGKEGRRKLK